MIMNNVLKTLCKPNKTEDVEDNEEVEAFAKSGDIKIDRNEVLELIQ